MLHIGRKIEDELRRQERTVAWFARKLYCNRQNVYDIFKRESIDTSLLRRISAILGHDFFKDLSADMEWDKEANDIWHFCIIILFKDFFKRSFK